ncbi:MAG: hypothetical protein WDN27_00040 [Candidatus Saccharibacteria bacterium]
MPSVKSRAGFVDTEKGKEIRHELQLMTENDSYNTASSYSANGVLYPGNRMSFVEKHMSYLVAHPLLDADQYLANVRLVTRVR